MLSNQEHINQLWRQQALAQRHLDNARVLWARVVEKNRRGVEEKAEQLRATAFTAALVAGFANVAFMQFDYVYDDPTGVVLPIFAASMALTVSMSSDKQPASALMSAMHSQNTQSKSSVSGASHMNMQPQHGHEPANTLATYAYALGTCLLTSIVMCHARVQHVWGVVLSCADQHGDYLHCHLHPHVGQYNKDGPKLCIRGRGG